jgi:hypothetical protein
MPAVTPSLERLRSRWPEGAVSPEDAGFDCAPDGDTWHLGIWGSMASSWAGNLSLHCCVSRIAILDGEARRVAERFWVGTFRIATAVGATSPSGFDFLQMARRRPAVIPILTAPRIVSTEIDAGAEGRASSIEVVGHDEVGFLARVLQKIASCGLEPESVSLRTTDDGIAIDRFVLRDLDGTPASHGALTRVAGRLQPR